MAQSTLSYQTLKNSSYSLLGYVFPIVFSVLITPVIVRTLGVAEYGILLLVYAIIGFLGLIDLGLGTSLVKYIPEYRAKQDMDTVNKLVNSANVLFFCFGLVGLLVFVVLGKFFLPLFHIAPGEQRYVFTAFLLGGLWCFLNTVFTTFSYLPNALLRYDISVKLSLFQLTVSNILALILVLAGYRLQAILIANIAVSIVVILANIWYAKKLLPSLALRLAWDKGLVKKCYSFGIVVFLTNISNNVLARFDRLIIPLYLAPAQLSFYSLPGNVAEKVNGIAGSATTVFFPTVSSLSGGGKEEQIRAIYEKVMRIVMVFAAALAFPIIFFAEKILLFWLGQSFAVHSANVLVLLAVTNYLLALYSVLINFLLGLGKTVFLMKAAAVMAVINLLLLVALIPKFGINGAAWAYLGAVMPVAWIIFWVERKYFSLGFRYKFYLKSLAKILAAAAILYGIARFGLLPITTKLWQLVIFGPLSVLLYLALYKLLGFFEKEDWVLFVGFFGQVLQRLGIKKQ